MENYNRHMEEEQNNSLEPQPQQEVEVEKNSCGEKWWVRLFRKEEVEEWRSSSKWHRFKMLVIGILGLIDNLLAPIAMAGIILYEQWLLSDGEDFASFAARRSEEFSVYWWTPITLTLSSFIICLIGWRPLHLYGIPDVRFIFSKKRVLDYLSALGYLCIAGLITVVGLYIRSYFEEDIPIWIVSERAKNILSTSFPLYLLNTITLFSLVLLRVFLKADKDSDGLWLFTLPH
ncbi:MAG: hypothetical protein J6X92_02275 [Bacteroidales bacterium]|nr:hypothetical protein [Bacteroidales bacterium]